VFSDWAKLALEWQHYAPACVVAEELADVTHAGKASKGWGPLVRGGLAYGCRIIGITQRVQEIDKSIFGNSNEMRIFAQNNDDDYAYLAKKTGIDLKLLQSLGQYEFLLKSDRSEKIEHIKP